MKNVISLRKFMIRWMIGVFAVFGIVFITILIMGAEDEGRNKWNYIYQIVTSLDFSEKIEYGTKMHYKGVPIYLESRNVRIDSLNKSLQMQPDVLLSNCKAIYVCSPEEETTCSKNYNNKDETFSNIGGYAESDTMQIYINENALTKYNGFGTITHELSHLYDYLMEESSNGQLWDESWNSLYEQYQDEFSNYGTTNNNEFFAESMMFYFQYPEEMQEGNRKIFYEMFQSIFHYYPE